MQVQDPKYLEPNVRYRAIAPNGDQCDAVLKADRSRRCLTVNLYAIGDRYNPAKGKLRSMVADGWLFKR